MHGRRYYLTTLGAWRRHAPRCAETHFVVLAAQRTAESLAGAGEAFRPTLTTGRGVVASSDDATQILALISADEGAHIALENDADVAPLPHPLARTPVPERIAAALAHLGVAPGDDTFTVAEKLARVHPLLRHRVF